MLRTTFPSSVFVYRRQRLRRRWKCICSASIAEHVRCLAARIRDTSRQPAYESRETPRWLPVMKATKDAVFKRASGPVLKTSSHGADADTDRSSYRLDHQQQALKICRQRRQLRIGNVVSVSTASPGSVAPAFENTVPEPAPVHVRWRSVSLPRFGSSVAPPRSTGHMAAAEHLGLDHNSG